MNCSDNVASFNLLRIGLSEDDEPSCFIKARNFLRFMLRLCLMKMVLSFAAYALTRPSIRVLQL
jgi:hypothetical protein